MTADRRQTPIHLLLLVAIAVLFTWPALVHGLPDLSADGVEHARWTNAFAIQFWQGEWYPRWLTGTNGGLGAPALFFYPSMANYGAAIFRPVLGAHDPNGFLIAGWSAVLAGILSAITAYFWLRDLTTPLAALFGAALYVISPYHLAINLYNRGALAEFWAFVWMPLVMLAAKRCAEGGRWAIPGIAASFGLLAFTHLPTVVCFSWVVPLAVWMMSQPGKGGRALARMCAGIALGIGLAAVYLLPARLDEKKSWIGIVSDDAWFYYRNNYLFTKLVSPIEYKARVLVLVLSIAACTALFYGVSQRFELDPRRRRLSLLYLMVAVGALFMMTQLSIPVYEVFIFVQKIQFPSRFASTLTVALAALAALTFPLLKKQKVVLAVAGLLIVGWIGADTWAGLTAFSVWRKVPRERLESNRKWTELQREYYSLWPRPADSPRLSEPQALEAFLAAHPARSLVLNAGGSAVVESWRPREVAIRVHAPENGRMTVGHFYYRDWRAHIQGSGQSVAVTPSPEGLLEVETPRGDYTLTLELVRDTPERVGIWISAGSLGLVCGLVIIASGGKSSKS